ncbi:MAG: DUF1294 domain-containing protein [Cognaticolwellia sp.]
MRLKGKIIKWHDDKAFGFIAPSSGGNPVFIHKTALANRQRIPKVNDVITFSITKDNQGRFCADDATFSGEKRIKKPAQNIGQFSLYLSLGFFAILLVGFVIRDLPLNLLLAYLAFSTITYVAYGLDKAKAQRGSWRTPESTLHFFALMGGWPGAAIAQQTLRHKSKKREFRMVFWLTVMINCAALTWLVSTNSALLFKLFT